MTQRCMKFAGCDGTLYGIPCVTGAESEQPLAVRGDQSFFSGLTLRSIVKTSWIKLLSRNLLMPISSDAAATITQNAAL